MPPLVRLGLEASVVAGVYKKLGNSPWKRKLLMFAGTLLLVWVLMLQLDTTSVELPEFTDPPIAYDHLSDEKTEPYLVWGKPPVKGADKRAARRWPDVRSCLMRSERKVENPDLRKMDWGKMRRDEDIEVCLFRIAASLRSPEAMRDWFVSQGMQYVEVTELKELPNVRPEDMWAVAAINRFSTGKTYRASPIPWRYWIMFISLGEDFGAVFSKDGDVSETDYFDNNIL